MKHTLYKESDQSISKWTGGTTKQLAIFPADGNYLEREFIWRLSSATVDMDESDFSKLPDFDRVLMVLQGEVVLAHQGERVARLNQFEQDRFSGAYKTKSFGKITDYNLMVRKGNQGFLSYIKVTGEPVKAAFNPHGDYQQHTVGYYCVNGYAVINVGGESVMLNPSEQLIIEGDKDDKFKIEIMGEGDLVQSEIYYTEVLGEYQATEIPTCKTTFEDFKECVYLSNVQFRGAKYIIKRVKNEWLDEALGGVVRTLEKTCVTMLVFLLVAAGLLILTYSKLSPGLIVGLLLLWLVLDCLVVSPLIYLAFVPKPVKPHIKDVHNLTPYEEKLRQQELNYNPRIEKIMRNTITGNDHADEITFLDLGRKK